MEPYEVLQKLRQKHGLTQEQMAQRLFVTRQAVSRWETGETVPNTETLKLISSIFDVSINTLLGSPRKLFCQCCGMPLNDESFSRDPDGSINEEYCRWCYTDGQFAYHSLDELVDYLAAHVAPKDWTPEMARNFFRTELQKLAYWKDR